MIHISFAVNCEVICLILLTAHAAARLLHPLLSVSVAGCTMDIEQVYSTSEEPPRHIMTLGALSFQNDSDILLLVRGPSSCLAQDVHSVSTHLRNRILSDLQKAVANLYYCQPLLSNVLCSRTVVLSRPAVQMSIDFQVTYEEVSK